MLTWPSRLRSQAIKVALVGAGGNGSEMFDGLVKIHHALQALGHTQGLEVSVWDDDEVTESVIVRQRFWPQEIGQNKAITLVHRANMMFGTVWSAIPRKFEANERYDLIISCVDNLAARKYIHETYHESITDLLWMDLGNGQHHGQIVIGHAGQTSNRVDNVIDHYPSILSEKDSPDTPSCSSAQSLSKQDLFINATMANKACNMLWELIRVGELKQTWECVETRAA